MPLLLNSRLMFSPPEIRALFALCFLYATRMLGLFMVLPVFALYASEYDGSTTILIGLSLGVYGLTQGILQIPFGLLSDRLGRRPLIIAGMLLFLAGSLLCAYASSIYLIIAGRALQGAGAVAGVIMALLSDLTREQVRTRAMALVGGSIGVAFAVAMVTGPLIASHWGMSGIFWLTAILAAVGIITVLLVVPNPSVRHSGHEVVPVPAMLTRVLADRQLLRVNAGIFFLHFAQIATWVVIPVMLEANFDFHRDQHWMLYLAAMGGGFVIMLPFVWYAETRHKVKPVFVGAIAVLAIAEGVMAMAGSLFQQLVIGLLLFFCGF
jgi:MFS family permease